MAAAFLWLLLLVACLVLAPSLLPPLGALILLSLFSPLLSSSSSSSSSPSLPHVSPPVSAFCLLMRCGIDSWITPSLCNPFISPFRIITLRTWPCLHLPPPHLSLHPSSPHLNLLLAGCHCEGVDLGILHGLILP